MINNNIFNYDNYNGNIQIEFSINYSHMYFNSNNDYMWDTVAMAKLETILLIQFIYQLIPASYLITKNCKNFYYKTVL